MFPEALCYPTKYLKQFKLDYKFSVKLNRYAIFFSALGFKTFLLASRFKYVANKVVFPLIRSFENFFEIRARIIRTL